MAHFQWPNSTNKGTALLRFAHQFSERSIVRDEYVTWFFDETTIEPLKIIPSQFDSEPKNNEEKFMRMGYWYIILREKHGDEAIEKAVTDGCQQLLLLGSGYDTRFFRLAFVRDIINTFEVDRPQTINDKQQRLKEKLGSIPEKLSLISLDFNQEYLNKLFEYGFDKNIPTAYIWQGVSYYLTQEKVAQVLEFVQANMAAGSIFVFDCCTPLMTYKNDLIPGIDSNIDKLSEIGEPYLFGMYPDRMEAWLKSKGFEEIEILGQQDLEAKYLDRRTLPDNAWYVVTVHKS